MCSISAVLSNGLSVCSVKGPELLNMYVGQSEQNVREGKVAYFIASFCVL